MGHPPIDNNFLQVNSFYLPEEEECFDSWNLSNFHRKEFVYPPFGERKRETLYLQISEENLQKSRMNLLNLARLPLCKRKEKQGKWKTRYNKRESLVLSEKAVALLEDEMLFPILRGS